MEINDAETHARLWTKSLLKAVEFTIKHHGSQTRKFNGEPYVLHPIRVAQKLLQYDPKSSTEMVYAALFHDLLEDSKTVKEDEIVSEFGAGVLNIVKELTNDRELITEMGKTRYLCAKVCRLSKGALTVKLCDRLDNISDIQPEKTECEWSTEYATQTYQILNSLEKEHVRLNFLDPTQCALFSAIKYKLKKAGYPESDF